MTLNAGDREYGHGDQITVKNTSGSDLDSGVPVQVTGHDGNHAEVGLASSANAADFVLADPAADGELAEAKRHGVVWVKEDGTLSAGGKADEGGSSGFVDAGSASAYTVLQAGVSDPNSSNTIALIAFEGK